MARPISQTDRVKNMQTYWQTCLLLQRGFFGVPHIDFLDIKVIISLMKFPDKGINMLATWSGTVKPIESPLSMRDQAHCS